MNLQINKFRISLYKKQIAKWFMEDYILLLENKNGETIFLEGIILNEIHFPRLPFGGEKIILHNSSTLIENYKKRASPFEGLQKRFSERTYIIKEINFGEKSLIKAVEENYPK